MLNNDGSMPSKNLEFECSNSGCVLKTTDLGDYNLTDLNELSFKGVKPKSGTVTIEDNGQTIKVANLEINGFTCNYPNSEGKVSCGKGTNNDDNPQTKTYTSGEAIELGGYNWHVIGDDGTNVTLLMDAGQIEDMYHCGSSCTNNVYSWDKSIINSYLKNTLYPTIKDKIENIVPVSVCIDPSRGDGVATYGGYLQSEIDKISGASCSKTEIDYVRLITYSEYWNLSPIYSGTSASYPNVSGITRLSNESDYAGWLYCNTNKCGGTLYAGYWWTMTSFYGSITSHVRNAYFVRFDGALVSHYGSALGVRPVITIKK